MIKGWAEKKHLSVHCVLQKCAEYWPEDTVTHEGIEITVITVTQEDDYSLRVFTLKVKQKGIALNLMETHQQANILPITTLTCKS